MITAQILGVMAVVAFLLSFQFKTRKNIILVNLLSRIFYILQYILLGAFEGAALDFIGFVSSFVAKNKDKEIITKYYKWLIVLINVVLLVVGLLLYENIYSIFALLGIFFEIMGLFLTKEKNIRAVSFVSAPMWLVYNFANRAYGSAVGSVLVMISIGVAMVRLDLKKSKKEV